jgi:hypothetical protein
MKEQSKRTGEAASENNTGPESTHRRLPRLSTTHIYYPDAYLSVA